MSSNDITLSRAQSSDIHEILKFYEVNFDNWNEVRRFWSWQQLENPSFQGPMHVLAKKKDVIVGCIAINPVRLSFKNSVINAAWQQDSLVDKPLRGQGLGRKLIHEAGKDCDIALAKGTGAAMYGLRKSYGYQDVKNANYLIWIKEPRSLKSRGWKSIAEVFFSLWQKAVPLPHLDDPIRVSEISAFDKSFDDLADLLSRQRILRIYKCRRYLNWRYFQCPEKRYTVFRAGNKDARGAIVTCISHRDKEEGWIVDLICSDDDEKCAFALLDKAIRTLRLSGIKRIWVFATLPTARRWLYRFGFLPTNNSPNFTHCLQNSELTQAGPLAWDFWHGDGDTELYT